jgi:hypothetical protein
MGKVKRIGDFYMHTRESPMTLRKSVDEIVRQVRRIIETEIRERRALDIINVVVVTRSDAEKTE